MTLLVSSWTVRMASINAKGHHHEWQSKPPDGKLEWSKTWDERYWDEEELAANFKLLCSRVKVNLENLEMCFYCGFHLGSQGKQRRFV